MLSHQNVCQSVVSRQHVPGPAVLVRRPIRTCTLAALPVNSETISYAALSIGGASFVTTFFVLPKLYTKNTDWQTMLSSLRDNGVRSISPREARNRLRSAVLLDVRLPDRAAESAPVGSINVPVFIPIQKWDVASIVRRLGFAFFGVPGTELNPDFIEQVKAAVPRGRDIYVICESGGSIEEKAGNTNGFQSRSLKAIYWLQQAGITNVAHVTGGLGAWVREGLPTTNGDDDDDQQGGEPATVSGRFSLPIFSSTRT